MTTGDSGSLGFPVDFLNVVVHRWGQRLTALRTTRLQHAAAILAAHALTETVYANTTTLLGLVGAFWHFPIPLSKNALRARFRAE